MRTRLSLLMSILRMTQSLPCLVLVWSTVRLCQHNIYQPKRGFLCSHSSFMYVLSGSLFHVCFACPAFHWLIDLGIITNFLESPLLIQCSALCTLSKAPELLQILTRSGAMTILQSLGDLDGNGCDGKTSISKSRSSSNLSSGSTGI